jgi:chemotaxis protein MotB
MSAPATPPIIIIKKKGGHGGGHHGGAWKVAYADFVTAMMALFIVLWLLNSTVEVQKAVAGYFRDPRGSGKRMGSAFGGTGESITVDRKNLSNLKNKLQQAMKETPKFEKVKNNVEMTVTGEGLRIELLESEKGTFFASGQAIPTDNAHDLLIEIAKELGKLPNTVLLEGHTDSKPFTGTNGYSNWELSADRANAARKLMEENGLRPDQVVQIRGYADQSLRDPEKPEDPANRRISIIVRYTEGPDIPEKDEKGKEGKEGKDGKAAEKGGKEEKADAKSSEAKPAETKSEQASKPAPAAEPAKASH